MVLDPYSCPETFRFNGMVEEDVVDKAKAGNHAALEYLIDRYKNLIRGKAVTYFLIGADTDDIIQEGMIGLYKAIRDFERDKLASFKTFAEICITRQIITAVKTATRQKHIPLNSSISLNKPLYAEESERTLLDLIDGGKTTDPMELLIGQENVDNISSKILEMLTELELEVFNHYLKGKTYNEIAKDLNREVKSIDNALQRVKKKLIKSLSN